MKKGRWQRAWIGMRRWPEMNLSSVPCAAPKRQYLMLFDQQLTATHQRQRKVLRELREMDP
jgi:hypothetical protein